MQWPSSRSGAVTILLPLSAAKRLRKHLRASRMASKLRIVVGHVMEVRSMRQRQSSSSGSLLAVGCSRLLGASGSTNRHAAPGFPSLQALVAASASRTMVTVRPALGLVAIDGQVVRPNQSEASMVRVFRDHAQPSLAGGDSCERSAGWR
jgi:hypothetical protein